MAKHRVQPKLETTEAITLERPFNKLMPSASASSRGEAGAAAAVPVGVRRPQRSSIVKHQVQCQTPPRIELLPFFRLGSACGWVS